MKLDQLGNYNCEKCVTNQEEHQDVNSPTHYTEGGVETIEIIKAKLTTEGYLGFLKGNVIKYMTRAGKKDDELKDYKKAQWYLNKIIEESEVK